MAECFKCGISEEKALLFDAISHSGIVKICRKCSIIENLPIIRKPKTEEEPLKSVSERITRISGTMGRGGSYIRQPRKDDMDLRELIEKNFRQNLKEDSEMKKNMIENFHWAMMRARRAKHMTQEQLAQTIKEPVIAIQNLEQGFVPEKSRELIGKIENCLFVRLKKPNTEIEKRETSFSQISNLKVSDLKEMKNEEESEIFDEDFSEAEEEKT